MLEIERKFLPSLTIPELIEAGKLQQAREPNEIIQGYLKISKEEEVRVSHRGFLTFKAGSGLVREERIVEIGVPAFDILLPLCGDNVVNKIRHYYHYSVDDSKRYSKKYLLEIDKYLGLDAGLVTVEIEFPSEGEAVIFKAPKWLGREVTGIRKYQNSYLAGKKNGLPVCTRLS
jgi:CYTH domain-containing protein